MWPDYIPDESGQKNSLGDVSELKAGIDYVHSRGGHVAMFLSYYLIDTESEFWQSGGERAAVKNLWGKPIPVRRDLLRRGHVAKARRAADADVCRLLRLGYVAGEDARVGQDLP